MPLSWFLFERCRKNDMLLNTFPERGPRFLLIEYHSERHIIKGIDVCHCMLFEFSSSRIVIPHCLHFLRTINF